MENASKALLIAAAVLIVILLIAFGMKIFDSTGDTAGQVEDLSSSQQMQTFNAQFTGYLGNRNGASLRNLLVTVNKSNDRSSQHDVLIYTSLAGTITGSETAEPTEAKQKTGSYGIDTTGASKFDNNNMYKITAKYDATGYIYAITVE